MGNIARILAFLPRNMTVPVIVLAIGWYGGAKFGAPDYVINTVDDLFSRGAGAVEALMGGGDDKPATDENAGADES